MDISPIDLQQALSGADFPLHRQGLVDLVRDNGAADDVVDAPRRIEDGDHDGPDSVDAAVVRAE